MIDLTCFIGQYYLTETRKDYYMRKYKNDELNLFNKWEGETRTEFYHQGFIERSLEYIGIFWVITFFLIAAGLSVFFIDDNLCKNIFIYNAMPLWFIYFISFEQY